MTPKGFDHARAFLKDIAEATDKKDERITIGVRDETYWRCTVINVTDGVVHVLHGDTDRRPVFIDIAAIVVVTS